MIVEDANTCDCGCGRRAHAFGIYDCRYHPDCRKFTPKQTEVPDIFEDDK